MGTLLVRDIEDDLEFALRRRAARHGVPVENEVRKILRDAVGKAEASHDQNLETPAQREARFLRILALGRPPSELFDLKAFSDAVSDGTE